VFRMSPNRLVVLGTGGTIAGRAVSASDNVGYKAGEVPVSELLGDVPVPPGCEVEAEQVAQIDSKDMDEAVWRRLLATVHRHLGRPEVQGIVVTHGTDTLEETACLLQWALNPVKPVVLVSAMRPASAAMRDGPQNLADGLQLAATPGAHGVVAVCAGRVHSALDVRKVHNHRLDVYDSGDAGPIAALEEGRLTQWRPWPETPHAGGSGRLERLLQQPVWPRVEWITSHGGQSGGLVRALLLQRASATDEPPIGGIVVAGTGNGTLHRDLLAALLEAEQAGVVVWRTTRCANGRVIEGGDCPITSTPWPPAKARLALMLHLASR
jgi:L-asparaginase